MILQISNANRQIVSTNFWQTDYDSRGLAYLSINAGAFRLLLPRRLEETIADMATGKIAVISMPRNPCKYAVEIMPASVGGAN